MIEEHTTAGEDHMAAGEEHMTAGEEVVMSACIYIGEYMHMHALHDHTWYTSLFIHVYILLDTNTNTWPHTHK